MIRYSHSSDLAGGMRYHRRWLPKASHPSYLQVQRRCTEQLQEPNNLKRTRQRMMQTLNWEWTLSNKMTLIFTCVYTMLRLLHWNNKLTREYLCKLFAIA